MSGLCFRDSFPSGATLTCVCTIEMSNPECIFQDHKMSNSYNIHHSYLLTAPFHLQFTITTLSDVVWRRVLVCRLYLACRWGQGNYLSEGIFRVMYGGKRTVLSSEGPGSLGVIPLNWFNFGNLWYSFLWRSRRNHQLFTARKMMWNSLARKHLWEQSL